MTYIGFLLSRLQLQNEYSEDQQVLLEDLFMETNDQLYGYIYQMIGDIDQSLDFVQEAFVRLLKTGKKFTDKDHIRNYLFRIARNLCLTSFREKELKQHLSVENLSEKGFFFHDRREDLVRKIKENEIEAILTDFIKDRPEKQKTILNLKKIEGMKYEDIADITGLSVRQLKRIVKSELDHFASLFEEYGIQQMEDVV